MREVWTSRTSLEAREVQSRTRPHAGLRPPVGNARATHKCRRLFVGGCFQRGLHEKSSFLTYVSRKGAKAQRNPLKTRQRFAPLRETIFLTSVLQVFEDEVGHHLAHVLEL